MDYYRTREIAGKNEAHLNPEFNSQVKPFTQNPNPLGDGEAPRNPRRRVICFKKKAKAPQSSKAKAKLAAKELAKERERQIAEVKSLRGKIESGKIKADPRLSGLASNWLKSAESWQVKGENL